MGRYLLSSESMSNIVKLKGAGGTVLLSLCGNVRATFHLCQKYTYQKFQSTKYVERMFSFIFSCFKIFASFLNSQKSS